MKVQRSTALTIAQFKQVVRIYGSSINNDFDLFAIRYMYYCYRKDSPTEATIGALNHSAELVTQFEAINDMRNVQEEREDRRNENKAKKCCIADYSNEVMA